MAVIDWAKTNFSAYFDNATARRDYRTQMRSPRSVWLWAAYLGLMILVAAFTYGANVMMGELTVVDAQSRLQQFYDTILYLLAAMVTLVAPALAATSVAVERERRSLDLIFSAPVKPKAYLVGKMIAAYRYTWILLVLALPVTALCVVLGGATWGEVLAAFAILSFHGLIYSAIALTISAVTARPAAAVVYSYVAVLGVSLGLGVMAMSSYTQGSWDGAEQSFLGALSPLGASVAAKSHTTFAMPWGALQVPHWALLGIVSLFTVRLLLLGAASALAPSKAIETRTLRVSGLFVMALFSGLWAWQLLGRFDYTHATIEAQTMRQVAASSLAVAGPMLLVLLLPVMATHGKGAQRRFLDDGPWSVRRAFDGTPSGALPYLTMVTLVSAATVAGVVILVAGFWPGSLFFATVGWQLGLWVFLWSLGRLASSFDFELKTARVLHFALILAMLGLPIPILMALDPSLQSGLWVAHPVFPLFGISVSTAGSQLATGIALALLGMAILWSRSRSRKRATA